MEIILFTLVCNVDAVYDRPPGEVMSSPHYGVWKFNTVEERNISSLQPSHRMEEVFSVSRGNFEATNYTGCYSSIMSNFSNNFLRFSRKIL